MKKERFIIKVFTSVCLIFLLSKGGLGSEDYPSTSKREKRLTPISLDYPNNQGEVYQPLVPLNSYSTEKGKNLAQKYRVELIQVVKLLRDNYPPDQVEIRAVGFLRSPFNEGKDDRYLSVIMEVSEEYEVENLPFEKRAGMIFKKYVDPIARMLLQFENILKDKRIEGVAICPNWMLKGTQKVLDKTKLSEGIFVCINSEIGKDFFQGKINLPQLTDQAKIFGREGEKIFVLKDIRIE
ncbi:MAG: hypothetical protein DRG25_06670 [Deltaproteobacteria bacterium]|nr:MAG: hypothetical protein DRG25_06670 [Deltaproteobacteria bacterium]